MPPTYYAQPPDLPGTSREPTQEPVDDLWTNLLSNLPGGPRNPGSRNTLHGQPPEFLTSLPNGRSVRRCPGGSRPPDPTTQEPQEPTYSLLVARKR